MSREYQTSHGPLTVGGLPVQLVLDNGMEHFAEAVTKGALMLGVVINPTKAFYKHQNGPAESTFSGLNKQLFKALPNRMLPCSSRSSWTFPRWSASTTSRARWSEHARASTTPSMPSRPHSQALDCACTRATGSSRSPRPTPPTNDSSKPSDGSATSASA